MLFTSNILIHIRETILLKNILKDSSLELVCLNVYLFNDFELVHPPCFVLNVTVTDNYSFLLT